MENEMMYSSPLFDCATITVYGKSVGVRQDDALIEKDRVVLIKNIGRPDKDASRPYGNGNIDGHKGPGTADCERTDAQLVPRRDLDRGLVPRPIFLARSLRCCA